MRRFVLVALLVVSCSPTEETATPSSSTSTTQATTTTTITTTTTPTTEREPFGVSSPSFEHGAPIPRDHTCDGADVSPELDIVGIPPSTQSLAIIVDDPDAPLGTWDHWVEFNIVSESNFLDVQRASEPIGTQGLNSWHLTGYRGPCPPEGEDHEYRFTVYALETTLDLPSGVESGPLYSAMEGHILTSAVLTGTYSR
jgi:Raf kinase inhibitor-like YbhB/YbcL family protein